MILSPFQHSLQSQLSFAELSGDFNPIHLDSIRARRTMFGQIVAHGIHNVLCGIEKFLKIHPLSINRLSVTFRNPVFLKENIIVVPSNIFKNTIELSLQCQGLETTKIRLYGKTQSPKPTSFSLKTTNFSRQPADRTFEDIKNDLGSFKLSGNVNAIKSAFPHSTRALGIDGVARLLGLSKLIGMRCPGLHSLFSGFDVVFSNQRSDEPTQYWVTHSDDRISMITITLKGGGMTGKVNAFVRPQPILQPSITTVKPHVTGTPFKKMRALIIGGSRGLGEITAKIVAAGGGETAITYLSGKQDAEFVAKDISKYGCTCKVLQLDVLKPTIAIQSLRKRGWLPTHLMYFATPRISSRPDKDNTDKFYNIYSNGLIKVVEDLLSQSEGTLTLFYPSSIYVQEAPANFTQYATAKRKGEMTAKSLERSTPKLKVIIERLKPLATDQSATLLNVDLASPLETMVQILTKKLL